MCRFIVVEHECDTCNLDNLLGGYGFRRFTHHFPKTINKNRKEMFPSLVKKLSLSSKITSNGVYAKDYSYHVMLWGDYIILEVYEIELIDIFTPEMLEAVDVLKVNTNYHRLCFESNDRLKCDVCNGFGIINKRYSTEELFEFTYNFPKLVKLDLSYNSIENFDDESFARGPFKNLKVLDLSGNYEINIDTKNKFKGLENLKYLLLNELNDLESIEHILLNKDKNEEWIIPFKGMFNHLPNLRELQLQGAFSLEMDELPNNLFQQLKKLKALYLLDNEFTTIHPGAFSNLKQLEYLDLSKNKITNLSPLLFQNIPSLKEIKIRQNSLDESTVTFLRKIGFEQYDSFFKKSQPNRGAY